MYVLGGEARFPGWLVGEKTKPRSVSHVRCRRSHASEKKKMSVRAWE